MTNNKVKSLKVLRKVYRAIWGQYQLPDNIIEENPTEISLILQNYLSNNSPCMIARYGSTELTAVVNYLGIINSAKSIRNFISGKCPEWWWNKNIMKQMENWSGFYPSTEKNLERFSKLILEDSKQLDVLGSWQKEEQLIPTLPKNLIKVDFEPLNPFFTDSPWTNALSGKRVVVIHPFAKSILKQYKIKDKIFANDLLPDFDLKVIPAVQSIGGNSRYNDWFEALDYMKDTLDKVEYDICLLGCGAYGFPLAAHVKRSGKKAFHLGGSLQLLFGIRGSRWEDPNYNPIYNYSTLMNEYWTRPEKDETPSSANQVEGACYW